MTRSPHLAALLTLLRRPAAWGFVLLSLCVLVGQAGAPAPTPGGPAGTSACC